MDIVHPAIESYLHALLTSDDDPVLREMDEETDRRGFPAVGRTVGVTLEVLARSIGAQKVFELGSGFGFSGYYFARAVGPGGEVHLTDNDPANQAAAQDFLSRAGLWDRITYHVGDALESFEAVEGSFDVVFCDIDKERYPDAWRAARARVRVGGLYLADNVLWSGRVTGEEPDTRPGDTAAILEHIRPTV